MLNLLLFLSFSLAQKLNVVEIESKPTLIPVKITVVIKDIKTPKGQILMGIYKDDISFDKEIPYKKVQAFKTKISNGRLEVEVKLEPGKYGISLMDDENFNGKMDYNFIGIPKEGFGFSNYYHTGLSKPKLNLFEFDVSEKIIPKVEVPMRYM